LSATKTTFFAALVLVLTFAGGVLAGAFGHRALMMRTHRMPPMATRAIIHHLDRRLDLTDAQRTKIEQILETHHRRIYALTRSVRPRVHAELEAANAEIAAVLTPEQRREFARIRMHLGPGHRGGPPPH
jgi:Spy/CpxP family protein refolding chaperone